MVNRRAEASGGDGEHMSEFISKSTLRITFIAASALMAAMVAASYWVGVVNIRLERVRTCLEKWIPGDISALSKLRGGDPLR